MSELEKAIIRLNKGIEDAVEKIHDFYMSLPKYMRTEIMFPKKEAERNNEEDEKGEKEWLI